MDYNPALKDVAFLEGEWSMELSNASFLPDPNQKIPSEVRFKWLQSGAVLVMEQGQWESDAQAANWIVGRDDTSDNYTVLYNDKRGVSRVYDMSFHGSTWKMWRAEPGFRQRFEGKISDDKKTVKSYWEKSLDKGKTWSHDFDMTFTRLR
jgi:hypothetical protein